MIDVGSRIRDYEIVARLRSGGMATLFLARRCGAAGFARHVAIKVVHPHLANDPEFVRMFVEEAKLSAQIIHPNVVHVEELGETAGTYFLAMEYVHGSALSTLLSGLSRMHRRLSPEIAVWLAMRVADGLHAAHETTDENGAPLGVVHRDVSPQNVLVSNKGHVKLIDFGIAKATSSGKRTETGSLKGKLRYMAPEQAYGQNVDRRTDVYALGIVLWELLTMHRMFRAGNDFMLLDEVRNPNVEPPSKLVLDLPPALDAAVMAALARNPADRPATALDFKRLLGSAVPSANAVDPSQLAEVVDAVLGERMNARAKSLPDSIHPSGLTPRSAKVRPIDPDQVLQAMTMAAPGAQFTAESERSDSGVSTSYRQRIDSGGTPMSTRSAVGPRSIHPPPSRTFAMAAVALGILAIGVSGGLIIGQQQGAIDVAHGAPVIEDAPAERPAPAAPSELPVGASPAAPTATATPSAPTSISDLAAPNESPAVAPSLPGAEDGGSAVEVRSAVQRHERRRPARPSRARPSERDSENSPPPAHEGVRRAVDGVPIYDEEW